MPKAKAKAKAKAASNSKSQSHRSSPKKKPKDRKNKKVKSRSRKRQKTEDGYRSPLPNARPSRISLDSPPIAPVDPDGLPPSSTAIPSRLSLDSPSVAPIDPPPIAAGDLKSRLQAMVQGNLSYSNQQKQLGKYLALDCEMVGVGKNGARSSVARVSVVNYDGVVQLDEFVRQRERVVDYRTRFSGVRKGDLINAKSFEEIQSQVAGLSKDKVLVGHAISNDLRALSLSHPQPQTLDTQSYAWKFEVTKIKRIALRHLVYQELGVTIQDGEHSSVTDARATMAVFRLYEREWEKNLGPAVLNENKRKRKRKRDWEQEQEWEWERERARRWEREQWEWE